MARGDQLARQWRMLQILIGSRRGKAVSELAGEIGCHPRTAYRDLEALQIAGFPLYTDRKEGKNRWALLESARRHFPLPLSLSELMALYLSRRLLGAMKDTVFSDALESLFDKIRATLPPPTVSYIDRIAETLRVRSRGYRHSGAGTVAVDRIHEAILQRQSLDIVYYTMSRAREDRRRVDPYKLWFFDGAFYLIGYCHLRKGIRIFALDRIRDVADTGAAFETVEAFDSDRLMESSFGVFLGEPAKVRIRFSREVAGYITERIWHEDQVITARKDGGVDFEATVAGTEEIKFWVLGWGRHAEVLAPDRLRREIAEEVESMQRRYGSAGRGNGKGQRKSGV